MTAPQEIQAYLLSRALEDASYLQLDEAGRIIAAHDPRGWFTPAPRVGAEAASRYDWLFGVVPATSPSVLPRVELRPGSVVDVHLLQRFVLLTPAATSDDRRALLQMSNENALLQEALTRLRTRSQTAVLERLQEGLFKARPPAPTWLLEAGAPQAGAFAPGELFVFLETFLLEAEQFWSARAPQGRLSSAPWTEDGRSLQAFASLAEDGAPLLQIEPQGDEHRAQEALLQRARDLSIQHHQLHQETNKKELLLHCIVHDLSSPLSGIMGCLTGIQAMSPPESWAAYLKIGLRQAQRQRALIDQILDVFKADLAQIEAPQLRALDVDETLRTIFDAQRLLFEDHQLELQLQLSEGAQVQGLPDQLERVLINLLDNALRHAPRRSAVELGATVIGSDSVRFFVRDRGPGVPEEARSSLFQKLSQEGGTKGKLGLGLYFCRVTIERWGGQIGYEAPEDGAGARFWFTLPQPPSE